MEKTCVELLHLEDRVLHFLRGKTALVKLSLVTVIRLESSEVLLEVRTLRIPLVLVSKVISI